MGKDLVKQDINFLENPLWFQDKDMAQETEGFTWQDKEGFIYRAGYKPPVKIDAILLYALLLRSQRNEWQQELNLTRYEVIQECGLDPQQTYWYKRIVEGLERWTSVVVSFQGTFYDGIAYQAMQFHIIDSWQLDEKTKHLHINFSPKFLQRIQNSHYFKFIEFKEFRQLHSSLATRLYEILIKTFQGRSKWEIDSIKLAEKIPMNEKYPAHIISKIKSAVNRINECTELKIDLEIRRPERGKAIFVFRKLSKEAENAESMEVPKVVDVPEEKQGALERLLGMVREKERSKKTVLEMISRALRKRNEGYVERNIVYANRNATRHYRAYLSKALQHDWATEEESPEQQEMPSTPKQPERREATAEEVEAEVEARLGQMKETEVQWRMKQACIELAKERVKEEPHIHPNDISRQDAQERLLKILQEEVHRMLPSSQQK